MPQISVFFMLHHNCRYHPVTISIDAISVTAVRKLGWVVEIVPNELNHDVG